MAPTLRSHRTFDWYITSALASITALLFCVALVLNIFALLRGDDFLSGPPAGQSLQLLGGLTLVVVPCVFWFWFKMLNDYFRNRPEKHAVAWGWALFVLSIGAALAYFWCIWKPRNRQTLAADA